MDLKESVHGLLANFNHPIQNYANTLPYMLGGLSIVCLVMLMLSGIYLDLFYVPTVQQAYSSTMNIIQNVPFGEFARGVHLWSANIIVILLILHLSRIILTGSYKKPRRMLYIVGVLMFFVILFLTYLGTVLPLDQVGVDAAVRSQQTAALFGINVPFSQMIGPTAEMHVSVMIFVLLLLLGIHMYLIEKIGISVRAEKDAVSRKTAGEGTSDFMTHLIILTGFGCLLASFTCLLALLYPAPIGHAGVYDPSIMITKPVEAVFYANDKMLDAFGPTSIIWGPLLLLVLLMAFPFVDRNKYVYWKRRIPAMLLGVFVLLWGLYFFYIDVISPVQYNGICVNQPVNGTCISAENQTAENITALENETLGLNATLYFVSNGTLAKPADVYGGFVNFTSPLQGEMPIIAVGVAILAVLGVSILMFDRIKNILPNK